MRVTLNLRCILHYIVMRYDMCRMGERNKEKHHSKVPTHLESASGTRRRMRSRSCLRIASGLTRQHLTPLGGSSRLGSDTRSRRARADPRAKPLLLPIFYRT